jgi:hypothetical protein
LIFAAFAAVFLPLAFSMKIVSCTSEDSLPYAELTGGLLYTTAGAGSGFFSLTGEGAFAACFLGFAAFAG